ncbi:MAG TPA: hypothetical protein VG498_14000 [Terriglobales bacterium]|nr:hypothetical protein [Terriglobales bacterium]
MEIQEQKIAPRLRLAGILIALGLLVELFTLAWNNPIAFLVFLGLGGLLIFAGIVIYLLSLVSPQRVSQTPQRSMSGHASG